MPIPAAMVAQQQYRADGMPSGAARLLAECGLVEGDVPAALPAPLLATRGVQLDRDTFLMRLRSGLAFHYRRGRGTIVSRPADVAEAEVALYFEGSVHGAIAWLNGFVPLHASAVSIDGRVSAFTGVSGEGKSTLVAALANRGLTPCADDVVVLDLSDPAQVTAIPGHRRLKLWNDALALTGRASDSRVRPDIDKFYVAEDGFADSSGLPLERLYLLDSTSDRLAIAPIDGIARFAALQDSFYRPEFGTALAQSRGHFETVARLARAVAMRRFSRPRDRASFAAGIDLIAADLHAPLTAQDRT